MWWDRRARRRLSCALFRLRTVVRTSCPRSKSSAIHHPATNPVPPVTSTVSAILSPLLPKRRFNLRYS